MMDQLVTARPMNAAEKRKENRVLARAIALSILRENDSGRFQLDIELMPTDHVLQRWAACIGDGMSDKWDDSRKSRVSPLDDSTAIVVDQIILKSPHRYRSLARQWYCGAGSSTAIAEKLGVSRSGLYLEWRCSLFHYMRRFLDSGHKDLIGLMEKLS